MKRAAILMALLAGVLSAQANLLTNPGFEGAWNTGTGDQWSDRTPAGWWTYQAGNGNLETWAAETGTNGAAFYGWNTGGWAGIGQDVGVDTVDGNVFSFSMNVLAEPNFSSTNSELWLKMEFWSGGSEVYNTGEYSIYDAAKAAGETWNTYTLTYTNTDLSIDMVKPIIGSGGWENTGGNQSLKLDNAVFLQSAVPEPVSASLLGLGILAIYALRRKMRK
ncbi:MAG: PEP-CTERM sorting domain-containing protein [Kiritimatiellae bacterium]|nr:PEP-CTERM sorting domain-containing protein [Kiritimatiellia bacterium]MDD4737393.1 PEP-CTERM sorting domain-containing protein [Kiritimatiellia bacterium]